MDKYLHRAENFIFSIIFHSVIRSNFKAILAYSSVLLFTGLVGFISISVSNYVDKTMSINLVPANLNDQGLEKIEQNSVTINVRKGDTLSTILKSQNLAQEEISQIIDLVKKNNKELLLKPGNSIIFDYELKLIESETSDLNTEVNSLNGIKIIIDKLNSINIVKNENGFNINNNTVLINRYITQYTEVIESNLISTLQCIGVSSNNISELINAYSYQVDFQRQIHSGDTITVIIEKFKTEDGAVSHHGKVLFASLTLAGKKHNIYRYNNKDREHSFFSEDGKSVKRSLLKTPVNIIRVSSKYGNRKHPIDGYTKTHRGVDFAAPEGTPIYAAGDGVITELGWKSGYGKFLQIKHSPTLSTAYAHAKGFAKNLKIGSRVKQGNVIAYVGSTGKTTGPHLHYEVKVEGKHINPMSIKTTPDIQLTNNNLKAFQQFKLYMNSLSKDLNKTTEISEANISANNLLNLGA